MREDRGGGVREEEKGGSMTLLLRRAVHLSTNFKYLGWCFPECIQHTTVVYEMILSGA